MNKINEISDTIKLNDKGLTIKEIIDELFMIYKHKPTRNTIQLRLIRHGARANKSIKRDYSVRIKHESGDIMGDVKLTGKCYVNDKRERFVECICKCGKIVWLNFLRLNSGKTKSCGCRYRSLEGASQHDIYSNWEHMYSRCYNEKHDSYHNYGGRGIIICQEWLKRPMAFIEWSLLNGWEKGLSIERINNDGNYGPSNCRWATQYIQSRNKRSNFYITAFGETKCAKDWVLDNRCSVAHNTLIRRIRKMGIQPEIAISTVRGKFSYLKLKSEKCLT